MPFAILHHSTVDSQDLVPGQSLLDITQTPEFSLHWGQGPTECVQFGIQIDRKTILELAKQITAGNWGEHDNVTLYSTPVERDECNASIKALRRARDAVYGADA